MPTLVGFQETFDGCEPLDEALWQAWLARNRTRELRRRQGRVKIVKWVSVVTLVVASIFGSQLESYGVIVRFALMLGAIVVMLDAVNFRHYTFATLFGTLALLYNPVFPVVNFSGLWQIGFLILSAALFVASLGWPRAKLMQTVYGSDLGSYPGSKRPTVINVNAEKERADRHL